MTATFTVYELSKLYKDYEKNGSSYKKTYLKKAAVILA
jgi:hypothetical protein